MVHSRDMYDATDLDSASGGYLIAELPGRERPRERLVEKGADSLSDAELLAIVLRSGRRGQSALSLAREVLHNFDGDLPRLAASSVRELQRIRGIGPAKAVEIHAAFALAQRLCDAAAPARRRIRGPRDVVEMFAHRFRSATKEEFHILLLDTKQYLLRSECVSVGLVDRSHVHPREVFRNAIRESCSKIVLVHNHPSGDPTPSEQDLLCTQQLLASGKIIGIEVTDHVIIGTQTRHRPKEYLSFREEDLLKPKAGKKEDA